MGKVKISEIRGDAISLASTELKSLATPVSKQPPMDRPVGTAIVTFSKIVAPVYSPEVLYSLYDNDADVQAVIDHTVAAVCGSGVTVKRRDASDILGASVGEQFNSTPTGEITSQEKAQLDKLVEFIELPNEEFDLATTTELWFKDVLVTGQGFVEWGRNALGDVAKCWYAPSITTRIGRDKRLFFQISGNSVKAFRNLGAPEVAIIQQCVLRTREDGRRKFTGDRVTVDLVLGLLEKEKNKNYKEDLKKYSFDPKTYMEQASLDMPLFEVGKSTEELEARSLGEMSMFRIPDPQSSFYGRSPIIAAIADHLIIKSINDYNLKFFENNTVPPIALIIQGSEIGEDSLEYVMSTIARHAGEGDQHKMLVVQVDESTEVKVEKLNNERLSEGTFLKQKMESSKRLFAVYRVPESNVYSTNVSDRQASEANRRFIDWVVKPYQRRLNNFYNRVIREQMGIDAWKIEFVTADADSLRDLATIWETFLRQGVININEVRDNLGLAPVEGGDFNSRIIPGTGMVIIRDQEKFSSKALNNEPRTDMNPVGGAQTPAKGMNPIFTPGESNNGEAT